MGGKNLLALGGAVVAEDDRFASAAGESGESALVGHPARETQSVIQGLVIAAVIPEPRAARPGAKRGVVNGNNAAIAGSRVFRKDDALVAGYGLLGDFHGGAEINLSEGEAKGRTEPASSGTPWDYYHTSTKRPVLDYFQLSFQNIFERIERDFLRLTCQHHIGASAGCTADPHLADPHQALAEIPEDP